MKRVLLFLLINLILLLLSLAVSGRLLRFPDTSLMSAGIETLLLLLSGLLTLPVYNGFRRKNIAALCVTLLVFTVLVMLVSASAAQLTALYFETGSKLSFLKGALRVFDEGIYKGLLFVLVLYYRPKGSATVPEPKAGDEKPLSS